MKKVLIITIIIVFSFGAFAQKFSGGLMIGPTLGWLKSDSKDIEKISSRFSYTWGAFIDRNLGDNFALSTGIFINEVGGGISYDKIIGMDYDDTTIFIPSKTGIYHKLRYIEIPISLKGMTNEVGHFKYQLKIGLSPMIKWKAKADFSPAPVQGKETQNINISSEIRAFNMAFHVGGGAQFLLGGNTALIGEIVYYNGISDITSNNSTKFNEYSVLSHQIVLRVGIKF